MLRPGPGSADLVNKAGEIYRKRNCEKYWARNVGHGIALTIHEPPWIAGNDETVMNENMVVAIEPFLTYPPHGAFAHCDVVRVTAQGCERLSPGLLRGLMVVWMLAERG
jgi:Xaa-Pro aminopeptidase